MAQSKSKAETVPLPKESSTPISHKISSALPGGLFAWNLLRMNKDHRKTMRVMTINEMDSGLAQIPFNEFMNSFVPSKDVENEDKAIRQIVAKFTMDETLSDPSAKEAERYPGLIELIQASLNTDKLLARNVSRWTDDKTCKITPDIAIYKGKDGRPAHEEEDEDSADTHIQAQVDTGDAGDDSDNTEPFKSNMNYHHVDLFVEDKTKFDKAALRIDDKDVIPDGFDHKWARGQIGEYTSGILRCQNRTHLFSVLTVGKTARFLRWDRSGVIASMPISFVEDTASFVKFFYRYGQMADWERGHDQSVSPARQEDEDALQDFKNEILPTLPPSHKAMFEQAFNGVDADDQGWPLLTVVLDRLPPVPNSISAPPEKSSSQPSDSFDQPSLQVSSSTSNSDDKKIRLLIRYPRISSRSPFGRATKGFVALDLGEKKLKFLKDSWRYHGGDYHPEIDVYGKLQQAGVKNIAKVEGGGDVLGVDGKPQTTFAHTYLKVKSNDDEEYLPQRHYRLLIRQLGTPLEKYATSYSLCYYLLLVLIAHCMAWTQAEVLHRDISPNNIMIDEDAKTVEDMAFLIDWDLCRYKEDLNNGRAQKSRSGTWAFTSAALLKYPTKQHDLADDLESFVHVLHWFCLRFHSHDMSENHYNLASVLARVYFDAHREEGYDLGGEEKFKLMRKGGVCFTLTDKEVMPGLIRLVNRLSKICKKHYQTLDIEALEAASSKVLKRKKADPTSTQSTVNKLPMDSRNVLASFGLAEEEEEVKDPQTSGGTDIPIEDANKSERTVLDTAPTTGKLTDDDDFEIPEAPFAEHRTMLNAFNTLFTKKAMSSSLWGIPVKGHDGSIMMTDDDKRNDQFDLVMHRSLSIAPVPSYKNENKRTSTTAGLEAGSETASKRVRGSNTKSTAQLVASGSKTGQRVIKPLKSSKTQGTSKTKSSTHGKKKVDNGPVVPDEPDVFMG
ncbi:hypothetical protein C8Q75DRAFT_730482 [Abortiporus biennis]|nr:hypothetical protein C8Q75DRAFT_730482 [Abortiporus biennis]